MTGNKTDREIDRIVDELVRDEKTAGALKQKLHEAEEAGVRFAPEIVRNEDEGDDPFDNMPV